MHCSVMAAIVLLAGCLPCDAASPSDRALDKAYAAVKRHRLLTSAELACSTFVYVGIENGVASVTVAEKHGGRCGGDPDVAPARFHMEIDQARQRVLWDNNTDMQMRPVPRTSSAASSTRR